MVDAGDVDVVGLEEVETDPPPIVRGAAKIEDAERPVDPPALGQDDLAQQPVAPQPEPVRQRPGVAGIAQRNALGSRR